MDCCCGEVKIFENDGGVLHFLDKYKRKKETELVKILGS